MPLVFFSQRCDPTRWNVDNEVSLEIKNKADALASWYRQKTGNELKAIKILPRGVIKGSPELPKGYEG